MIGCTYSMYFYRTGKQSIQLIKLEQFKKKKSVVTVTDKGMHSVLIINALLLKTKLKFSYLAHKQLFLQKGKPTNLIIYTNNSFSKNKILI